MKQIKNIAHSIWWKILNCSGNDIFEICIETCCFKFITIYSANSISKGGNKWKCETHHESLKQDLIVNSKSLEVKIYKL